MVPDSYSSASKEKSPPVASTFPDASSVVVKLYRALSIEPVGENVPCAGSYSSADASSAVLQPDIHHPPAIKTLPEGSSVAASESRALAMDPVGENVPATGS
jgi:hypothetical protein